ncbi:TBC1 domain family member 5 isoform X2 [Patella vulgata]|uniref:TBC1 domain family member 5 isoform X2 n=1 Tax=Patella vulgata TaxID=6465 RepID=UPI0024A9386F|nr:TBC1 domain family member 5 isoform X2 [Patella vulgata]
METVLGKLRQSTSRIARRASLTGNGAPSVTKDEIIETIDKFIPPVTPESDNNNLKKAGSHDNGSPGSESSSASHAHSYSSEWERLFMRQNYFKKLQEQGMDGNLRSSRFRSVCWKLYLKVLPEEKENWSEHSLLWRNKYEDLKNKLIVNPRKEVEGIDLSLNNPLSQNNESPWNKFFQDNELRLTIKQDVIRTFPELEFFKSEVLREMMIDILFCFSREHYNLSYKQGMHELLAPLIFVLHCDHQAFQHACEIESIHYVPESFRELIKDIMNPSYLEHDAYAMFCQVLETVEPWYMSKDFVISQYRGKDFINAQPFAKCQDLNPSNRIVTKLTRIQDYILKKHDSELHLHLERLEIAPQIYGIRWIRLLFGREFPMQDLLMLWDAIFADGIGFDLVDYLFVSMLLYIRDLLLSSDYATCLSTLMKFPPVPDVHYFIVKSLYLREPNQYPRPPNYTYQTVNKIPGKTRNHKASPNPPEGKRGSTASLPVLENTTLRQTPSASSLARLETSSLRSYHSSPAGYSPGAISENESLHSSPTKYSTLPNRGGRNRGGKKLTKMQENDIQHHISYLQGRLNEKETMSRYCSSKLDVHIDRLQSELQQIDMEQNEEIFLALAGIKQVRDVLNGTLKFSQNLLDEDEININDNHYKDDVVIMTPDSDIAMTAEHDNRRELLRKRQKMFYQSSEENSENAESPESFNGVLRPRTEFELDDYEKHSKLRGGNATRNNMSESTISESQTSLSSDNMVESPNPLYRIESWEEVNG